MPFYIYLLPLAAALTYAMNQVMTRMLGVASKASAMAVYVQARLSLSSLGVWGIRGRRAVRRKGWKTKALIFLLRAWTWPRGT